MDKRVVFCKTKRFDGDDAVTTKLTLDFSNVVESDLVEYAIDALVIKWQASKRRKKDAIIPREDTYVVPKPGTRTAPQLTPLEHLYELFGKEKVLALINKKGGDVDAVIKQFQAILGEMEEEKE